MAGDAYDYVVIGSGPAGQKAAIQAAKAGRRVALIERQREVGGACVHSGTIPSKALREKALQLTRARQAGNAFQLGIVASVPLSALLAGVEEIVAAHDRYMAAQLERNGIRCIRGRASFRSPTALDILRVDGTRLAIEGERILIAVGSRPRQPPELAVDHEHILDSDSILSLPYIPRSMVVLGSGVIACEYASIFAALGCAVTLIDKAAEPLGFLDPALRTGFLTAFQAMGGKYRGGVEVAGARFDGFSQVEVQLRGGEVLSADIVFAAFGRVANLEGIGLDRLQLAISSRGHVQVDEQYQTNIPGIFAAGDTIGPPALACAAADQGRRAALAALGLPPPAHTSLVPSGVYTIPEIACVGLSRSGAASKKIDVIVGRADFSEVARAHIAGEATGFLELLCDRSTARVLGCQAIGEGATDLVHLGQAAIATGATADFFIEQIFNFPTMTEAYRIAAFDVLKQRSVPHAAHLKLAHAAN